ncbi:MAG: CDP-glycerol glycerophosphotransferase family protein [bacterium]|nr:CDP-glycerol glycerophosphotransferase family protein [bacterium]
MEYKIQVKSFILEQNKLTMTIMGEISDSAINSHYLSRPKIILYFNNGSEDRRIPFVLSNITYVQGKCFFSGKYTYMLDQIFWHTRKDCSPFKMSFNFSFADFYEEEIPVEIKPEIVETIDSGFPCKIKGNMVEFFPIKRKIYPSLPSKIFFGVLNLLIVTFEYLVAILMLPIFVIDGLICMTLNKSMPARINDENPLKRFFAFVFWRFSQVATKKVSIWTAKRFVFKALYNFYRLRKIDRKKITFISLRRNDLSGNFAFVYEKLKKDKSLKIDFILNEHTISEMSFGEINKFTKACATSKVIILDEFTPQIHYIDLRKETKLIQLWHACGAFKTFGFTRLSKPMGSPQKTRNHRSYDYVTVSSSYCKKCHSEGFGIPTDNVVPTGIPRTDVFFDEQYKEKARADFYEKHPNFIGKKIVLFAPTFRGMVKETAFYPTEMFDLEEVCSKLPDDYVFIVKHHPFVSDKQPIPKKYADRVIDLSQDNELNDLLFVTDVIITDYSSLVFEASLLNIPMIFYVFDLEKYINERDFYFDFKLYAPGKIVYSQNELIDSIKNEDYNTEKIEPFADMFFDYRDGKSTERVTKLIYSALEE